VRGPSPLLPAAAPSPLLPSSPTVVGVLLFDITRITSRTSLTHALPLPFERKKRSFAGKSFASFVLFQKLSNIKTNKRPLMLFL
jgi:hypothetical protein